jgi:hypothetical protein
MVRPCGVYFAIELSKQSWVIGFNTPLSEKISRRILSGFLVIGGIGQKDAHHRAAHAIGKVYLS